MDARVSKKLNVLGYTGDADIWNVSNFLNPCMEFSNLYIEIEGLLTAESSELVKN